jgi:hypothetical protein
MDTNTEQDLTQPTDEELELLDDEEDDAGEDDEDDGSQDNNAEPQKITLGGREFTLEELESRLAEKEQGADTESSEEEADSMPTIEDILSEIEGYDPSYSTENEQALAKMVAEQRIAILKLVNAVKPIVQDHRSTVQERTAATKLAKATGKSTDEALAAYRAAKGDEVKAAVVLAGTKAPSKQVRKVAVAPGDRSQRTDGSKSDIDILREAEAMARRG